MRLSQRISLAIALMQSCQEDYPITGLKVHDVEDGLDRITFASYSHSGYIFICFQGTKEPSDVIRDAQFKLVANAFGSGRVHYGFQRQYSKIATIVMDLVRGYTSDKIIFCGHSLGGALAMIAARHENMVITCGAPKAGDQEFNSKFRSSLSQIKLLRIVHRQDPIASLPPGDFEHPEAGRVIEFGCKWWPLKSIKSHFMKSYYELCARDGLV